MATQLLHPITADLRLARQLADVADAVSMSYFRSRDFQVERKADASFVTDADRAVERALRDRLAQERPSDGILGEEFGTEGQAARQWILDPIDGTASFLRGIPIWATLIGLAVDGKVEVGVVSAPALNRRWWAASGLGAYLDDDLADENTATDRRIQVSEVATLASAQVAYGSLKYWQEIDRVEPILELNRRAYRSQTIGDFWPYMLVAEGATEVACEVGVQPYDIAALIPIVQEAGGMLTAVNGTEGPWHGSMLATNGLLHDEVRAILNP